MVQRRVQHVVARHEQLRPEEVREVLQLRGCQPVLEPVVGGIHLAAQATAGDPRPSWGRGDGVREQFGGLALRICGCITNFTFLFNAAVTAACCSWPLQLR